MMQKIAAVLIIILCFVSMPVFKYSRAATTTVSQIVQKRINLVQEMPAMPEPFLMKDWRKETLDYDKFVFDFTKQGDYLPVGWWDHTHTNMGSDTFGLMSYVGKNNQGNDGSQEAINSMAAVLSATLAGVDKSNQDGINYVKMLQTFYNKDNGQDLILNNPKTEAGHTFWYELMPQILFNALTYYYPKVDNMEDIMKKTADKTADAVYELGGKYNRANFDVTAYDYINKDTFVGTWTEPDAAAGMAVIEYWAYAKFKDPKYLQAAKWSMDFLQRRPDNPSYEVLSYLAPYMAVRMNSELNENYNADKMINWVFSQTSPVRDGWGVMTEKWDGYDVHGLMGNTSDNGGYAFAMNTFSAFGSLAPLVRYDSRYSRDIGKWMLNVANNSRLFYADSLPVDHQSGTDFLGDPQHVIPYEGLRKTYLDKSLYASGDPTVYGWGNTDFSLYSGSYAGMLGGLIQITNVKGILQIDTLKTDYFHEQAYPTYLYYNPYTTNQKVEIKGLGNKKVDLYDTVSAQFVAKNVSEQATIPLIADNAAVIVVVPADGKMTHKDNKIWIDGVYVSQEAKPAVNIVKLQDKQVVAGVIPFNIEAYAPDKEKFKTLQVTFAGQEIYNKAQLPNNLSLDTTKYSNGFHKLIVTGTTNKGQTDLSVVELLVRNLNGKALITADAAQLATWKAIPPMPAEVKVVDGKAVIKETNPEGIYGGIMSPAFKLDLSQQPIVVVDVDSVIANWTLQVHVKGEQWGYYIKKDGPQTGHFVMDVMKELRRIQPDMTYTGEQEVELWLIAAGAEDSSVTVKRLDMFYQEDEDSTQTKWEGKREAADLIDWKPIDTMAGKVYIDHAVATIKQDSLLDKGGIASPTMTVNLDKEPLITADVVSVSHQWSLQVYLQGANEGYIIQQPSTSLGKMTYDIKNLLTKAYPNIDLKGMKKMSVWLIAEGDSKATVNVNNVDLSYNVSNNVSKSSSHLMIIIPVIAAIIIALLLWRLVQRAIGKGHE